MSSHLVGEDVNRCLICLVQRIDLSVAGELFIGGHSGVRGHGGIRGLVSVRGRVVGLVGLFLEGIREHVLQLLDFGAEGTDLVVQFKHGLFTKFLMSGPLVHTLEPFVLVAPFRAIAMKVPRVTPAFLVSAGSNGPRIGRQGVWGWYKISLSTIDWVWSSCSAHSRWWWKRSRRKVHGS